jgi:uncharacterized protein YbjT (DUF2867 family)|nr:NmrA family NAD(P)-binding protein [Kofleriaceae bacterium]
MFAITGVTGNTGKHVALALLAAKQPVRVVLRDAAKAADWKSRGAEVAIADVGDEAALAGALAGTQGAYVLLPPPAWGHGGLVADRAAKIAAIAGAVKRAKPAQVVMLSSIGADQPAGTGPILDLRRLEAALTDTGVPTTFLRAAFFMDNWGSMLKGAVDGGALYYGAVDGKPFAQVATEDIGRTAAALLREAPPRGTRVVELAGPADYTFSDVAAALSKVAGKPVKAVTVPIAAVVQSLVGMGAHQEFADGMGELTDGLNKGLLQFHRVDRRGDVTLDSKLRSLLG